MPLPTVNPYFFKKFKMHSIEILKRLKNLNLLKNKPAWWWPNAGHFEVVVGALLTQNTRWENVEKALFNLKKEKILIENDEENLKCFAQINNLEKYIFPAGFYRQKSQRLILLSNNILRDFHSFKDFQKNVTQSWLLNQKGIGLEMADSILNYACFKPILTCDSYTLKFLKRFNINIQNYKEAQNYLMDFNENDLKRLYPNLSLAQIFARYHGKIVECSKLKLSDEDFFKIFQT